jgi:serine/threonine-protein kinase
MSEGQDIIQEQGRSLSATRAVDPARANRLRRARAIFTCACDMPPEERAAFIDDSCGGDLALSELVRSLLVADQGSCPAWDCAGVEVKPAVPALRLPENYEPIRELGRGGVGVVHLCRERESGDLVAVKVVHLASSGRSASARFRREWRLLSRLRHPALVALRAAGTLDGGSAYLAMEYVDGRDIRKHCREERVPSYRRMEMLASVADALGVAHEHGIVHRDLKPANILVERGNRARLIDFGAARVFEGEMHSRQEHTLTGQIVGTLSYLSPEQASGNSRRADHRSDLYQLGVVAFELLANRLPYDLEGQTSAEVLRSIIAEPAVSIDAIGVVPPGHPAQAFFARALAKDPVDRFSSASEMAAALRALAASLRPSRSRAARTAERPAQAAK